MPTFVVLRPFSSSVPHERGDEITLEGKHLQKLIDQRYIAPADSDVAIETKKRFGKPAAPAPAPVAESAPEPVKAAEAPAPKKRGRPPKAKPAADVIELA